MRWFQSTWTIVVSKWGLFRTVRWNNNVWQLKWILSFWNCFADILFWLVKPCMFSSFWIPCAIITLQSKHNTKEKKSCTDWTYSSGELKLRIIDEPVSKQSDTTTDSQFTENKISPHLSQWVRLHTSCCAILRDWKVHSTRESIWARDRELLLLVGSQLLPWWKKTIPVISRERERARVRRTTRPFWSTYAM